MAKGEVIDPDKTTVKELMERYGLKQWQAERWLDQLRHGVEPDLVEVDDDGHEVPQ